MFEELYAPARRGAALHRGQRGARDGRLRRSRHARGRRPDRRLGQRQARAAAPLDLDRRRARRRRWPTSSSATSTTSGPRRSGSRGAARARGSNRALLSRAAGERRGHDGRLELLGIESADPRWVRDAADALAESCYRLRALGTMASTVCQVAAARLDGMVSLKRCRAVDVAAAQLIVREAGGFVAFPWCDDPLGAPLDIPPHSPIVAARTGGHAGRARAIPPQGSPLAEGLPPSLRDRLEARHHRRRGHRRAQARARVDRVRARRRPDRGGRAAGLGLHRPGRRPSCRTPSRSTARSGSRPT